MQPDEGKQTEIDFVRGEQLRILRDSLLPPVIASGKKISPIVLKSVLKAIDDYGRGRACTASSETLARVACVSRRHCLRALEGLLQLGVICEAEPTSRRGILGQPTQCRRIVWSELSLLCDSGVFKKHPTSPPPKVSDPGSPCSTDQSDLGADQSDPRVTQHGIKRQLSACEAPTFVVGEVGAKEISWDGVAAVLAKANTLHERAGVHSEADRDLVLKIAVLWESGQLSEDMMRQVLESFERKAEAGDPVRDGQKWLWRCTWNQCRQKGLRFETLLARTHLPAELRAWQPEKTPRAIVEQTLQEKRAEASEFDEEIEELEDRFGEALDAMSNAEIQDLYDVAGVAEEWRDKRQLWRPQLLLTLAGRVEVA